MDQFLITIEVFDKNSRSVGIFSIETQAENKEAAHASLLKHNPKGQICFRNIQITALAKGGE